MDETNKSFIEIVIENFKKDKIAYGSFFVILGFCFIGLYAPFLASSKPIAVQYEGVWYFPLFRYLFFQGFYTKPLDLFFNILMFIVPLMGLNFLIFKKKKCLRNRIFFLLIVIQCVLFIYLLLNKVKDPQEDMQLGRERQEALKAFKNPSDFSFDLKYMNDYKKLNLLLRYQQLKRQNERLESFSEPYFIKMLKQFLEKEIQEKKLSYLRDRMSLEAIPKDAEIMQEILSNYSREDLKAKLQIPTLLNIMQENEQSQIAELEEAMTQNPDNQFAKSSLKYLRDKNAWLEKESRNLKYVVLPLIREFHFEDDAGGEQSLNEYLPWYELSRINRKDLTAALIFGTRVSLVVGILAVGLSLLIGVPIGAYAGYYGGTFDIIVSRILEILEAMPTFFMLLMIIAILESKSIFLVITMIGFFGWTGFSRYIRGEFFKQRHLPYVESCHALGFKNSYIMFSHILPNAIPPLLTLLPFAIMAAITTEAGLSFLGLGEEGSSSWGVLMDEGRTAFPQESYLLWPPAIMLTTLLVAIALVGDGLRDAIDPKLR